MPLDGNITELENKYKILDILKGARDRLAKPDGWCRDRMYNGDAACSAGAITLQFKNFDYSSGCLRKEAHKYLVLALPAKDAKWPSLPDLNQITFYNDEARRTQEEVVSLFDSAIKILEEELG